ncbi:hypothetical protein Bbelb_197140 [Branchiostoma belcheri]|nr:hypothetical protein Bbelb_197140 [Branchiostoma belcheri]
MERNPAAPRPLCTHNKQVPETDVPLHPTLLPLTASYYRVFIKLIDRFIGAEELVTGKTTGKGPTASPFISPPYLERFVRKHTNYRTILAGTGYTRTASRSLVEATARVQTQAANRPVTGISAVTHHRAGRENIYTGATVDSNSPINHCHKHEDDDTRIDVTSYQPRPRFRENSTCTLSRTGR